MAAWMDRKPNWLGWRKRERTDAPARPSSKPQADESDIYGVIYTPLKCPFCQSKKHHVTSSKPPDRYHKCDDCGQNFKSIEQD